MIIDTSYTDYMTCPHCGYEDIDDYGESYSDEKVYCGECGRYFKCESELSIHYSTEKIDWVREWIHYNHDKVSWAELKQLDR